MGQTFSATNSNNIIPSINQEERSSRIKHYSTSHKILLVGEGDFSFSACLAQAFGSASNMVATSLNSIGIDPTLASQLMLCDAPCTFSFASLHFCMHSLKSTVCYADFLSSNYGNALTNILELEWRGCRVMHGVDATLMASRYNLSRMQFDRIVFNFPHDGFNSGESSFSQIA